MQMLLGIVGGSFLILSEILCMYLDMKHDINSPPMYWGIGAIGGILSGTLITIAYILY